MKPGSIQTVTQTNAANLNSGVHLNTQELATLPFERRFSTDPTHNAMKLFNATSVRKLAIEKAKFLGIDTSKRSPKRRSAGGATVVPLNIPIGPPVIIALQADRAALDASICYEGEVVNRPVCIRDACLLYLVRVRNVSQRMCL